MCHNLTVLSMDEDSRKKFWIDRAKIKQDETEERTTTALFTLHNSSSGQESGGQRVITLHDWSATGVFTLHDSPSAGVPALLGLQCFVSRTHRRNDTGNAPGSFALYYVLKKQKEKNGILLFMLSALISCSSFDTTATSYKARCCLGGFKGSCLWMYLDLGGRRAKKQSVSLRLG